MVHSFSLFSQKYQEFLCHQSVCVCVCARASALAVVFVVTIGLLLSLGAFLEIVFVTDCCFLLIIIINRTM